MNIPLENQAVAQPHPLAGANPGAIRAFILSHAHTWMSAVLVAADITSLVISGFLALEVRFLLSSAIFRPGFDPFPYTRFSLLTVLFVAIYTLRGLYPAVGLGAVEEFRRLVINTSICFLSIATFSFAIQAPPVYSRFSFALTWIFALALVPLGRAAARAVCARLGVWGEPVAVVGEWGKAAELSDLLRRYPKVGLNPVLVCDHPTCPAGVGRAALARPDHGFGESCRNCPVRLARTALAVYNDYNQLEAIRAKYRDTFERVILVNHTDSGLSLSGVTVREFGGLAGLEIRQNLLNRWSQMEKRLIDIVASGLGLLMLSPLFAVLAVLIYIDTPGRIFYRQMRIGKDGRHFKLLKFRTMQLNADAYLRTYLEQHPDLKREWDQYQKLKVDPRITRVGGILRRFSLDELPQLWNVFTGDMSLVGPRPMMLNQQEAYGRAMDHYVRVTPGITGLWQVSGRNRTTFARRAELDVYYVMNWSIWMDLYILVRTVWVVIRQEGAG